MTAAWAAIDAHLRCNCQIFRGIIHAVDWDYLIGIHECRFQNRRQRQLFWFKFRRFGPRSFLKQVDSLIIAAGNFYRFLVPSCFCVCTCTKIMAKCESRVQNYNKAVTRIVTYRLVLQFNDKKEKSEEILFCWKLHTCKIIRLTELSKNPEHRTLSGATSDEFKPSS